MRSASTFTTQQHKGVRREQEIVYLTGGRCTLCRSTSVLNSLKLSAIVLRFCMSVLIVLFMIESRVDISANEKLCSLQNLVAQRRRGRSRVTTVAASTCKRGTTYA
jgi:hypothetical protein